MAKRKTKPGKPPLIVASPIPELRTSVWEAVRLAVRNTSGQCLGNVTVTIRVAEFVNVGTDDERAAMKQLAEDLGTVALAWTLRKDGHEQA